MSAYVRWLVAQKQQWHHSSDPEETALGFRGWHTRGYLPHFDVPGAQQMLNFRLADAMPKERQHEWASLLRIKDERQRRTRLEDYCDKGYGACELAISTVAQRMEDILLQDDNRRCRILAWVIMPNPVHLLIDRKRRGRAGNVGLALGLCGDDQLAYGRVSGRTQEHDREKERFRFHAHSCDSDGLISGPLTGEKRKSIKKVVSGRKSRADD